MSEKNLKSLRFHGLDDIYKIPSTAEDVGAATLEQVNQAMRKAAPRNLLDNSDFRNPVNQRGVTVSNNGFIVDRWYAFEGDVTNSKNGIITTGNGYLQQRLPSGTMKPESVYTLAVYYSDGTIDVNTNGEYVSMADFDIVNYIKSNGKTISSVALYEGEYTIDTLPEYQPKGYGAELFECMRYYQQSFTDNPQNPVNLQIVFGANPNWASTVKFPIPMRVRPEVILYNNVTGNADEVCIWKNDEAVSDVFANTVSTDGFNPYKPGGMVENLAYGLHYTADAELD